MGTSRDFDWTDWARKRPRWIYELYEVMTDQQRQKIRLRSVQAVNEFIVSLRETYPDLSTDVLRINAGYDAVKVLAEEDANQARLEAMQLTLDHSYRGGFLNKVKVTLMKELADCIEYCATVGDAPTNDEGWRGRVESVTKDPVANSLFQHSVLNLALAILKVSPPNSWNTTDSWDTLLYNSNPIVSWYAPVSDVNDALSAFQKFLAQAEEDMDGQAAEDTDGKNGADVIMDEVCPETSQEGDVALDPKCPGLNLTCAYERLVKWLDLLVSNEPATRRSQCEFGPLVWVSPEGGETHLGLCGLRGELITIVDWCFKHVCLREEKHLFERKMACLADMLVILNLKVDTALMEEFGAWRIIGFGEEKAARKAVLKRDREAGWKTVQLGPQTNPGQHERNIVRSQSVVAFAAVDEITAVRQSTVVARLAHLRLTKDAVQSLVPGETDSLSTAFVRFYTRAIAPQFAKGVLVFSSVQSDALREKISQAIQSRGAMIAVVTDQSVPCFLVCSLRSRGKQTLLLITTADCSDKDMVDGFNSYIADIGGPLENHWAGSTLTPVAQWFHQPSCDAPLFALWASRWIASLGGSSLTEKAILQSSRLREMKSLSEADRRNEAQARVRCDVSSWESKYSVE